MPNRRSPATLVASVLLLLTPASASASAGMVRLAEIGIVTDDNITSARNGTDRRDEQAVQFGLAQGLSAAVDRGIALRLIGRVDARVHARDQGLDEWTAGLDGQFLLRPGSRFHIPTLGLSLGIGTNQFASRLRDAKEARGRLFVQQALTTRLSTRGALFAVWRGSDSSAFDADWRGAELLLDWQARDRLRLSLGYQYRDGTVISVGQPGPAAVANASGLQPDDVFLGLTAFGFDAQTHIGSLAASYALSPQLTLQTQWRYTESDSAFGTRYRRWNSISGLMLRF